MINVLTTTLLEIKINDSSMSTGINYLTYLPKIGGCQLVAILDTGDEYPKKGAVITLKALNNGKNFDIFFGLDNEFLTY